MNVSEHDEVCSTRPTAAYAAVDLGASTGRVMLGLLSASGLEIRELHRFANGAITIDGRLHWDADALYAESMTGLRKAVAECAGQGIPLLGIGIDSWGVDFSLLGSQADAEPAPVRHHRGAPDPAPFISARSTLDENAVYAISGVPDQKINTSFQLVQYAVEDSLARQRLLFMPDLWVYQLTGAIGTEATIASTSQLMDPARDEWSEQLRLGNGVEEVILPDIYKPGSFAALTSEAVTQSLGSDKRIPVYRVASHDTASAFAFAHVADSDEIQGLISSGTWSLVGLALRDPIRSEQARLAQFTNERGANGTLFMRNLSGMWILQECLREWREFDGKESDISKLIAEASKARGSEYVFDVGNERLLAPDDMVERVTAMCVQAGRYAPASRGELVLAILESLAAAYVDSLEQVQRITGRRVTSVRIVSGGSNNALLCQLTANRLGFPVLAGPAEASSIGNIATQIVASGARSSIDELYATLSGPGAQTVTYTPEGMKG